MSVEDILAGLAMVVATVALPAHHNCKELLLDGELIEYICNENAKPVG